MSDERMVRQRLQAIVLLASMYLHGFEQSLIPLLTAAQLEQVKMTLGLTSPNAEGDGQASDAPARDAVLGRDSNDRGRRP